MIFMADTIAVLSDIHGVLPALEGVLAEPDVGAAGRIVLADYFVGARAGDAEAIAAFGPRDGRAVATTGADC
jgi:hypothetical protein